MATGMYKMALRMIPVNPYYIDGALFLFGLFSEWPLKEMILWYPSSVFPI